MALSLEIAQTLALGAFNPHIITPEWLVKNDVCADEEVEIRFIPMSQGMAFGFKEVQWQIDFRLLMVSSRKENCGELVARVMEKLPHTPVRAVGNNFHYACSREAWGHSPLPALTAVNQETLAAVGNMDQMRWTGVFMMEEGVRIEITVANGESSVAVLFNFHRDTRNTAESCAAARQFENDQRLSRDLLGRLFDQGVDQ